MRDIWSFLLQTLTVSGAAVLVLALKALFRDKLSPKWQFGIWSVLAVVLVVPAGLGGRYCLFHWPFYVEALRSALTGEYGALARVSIPLPIPALTAPQTWAEWLFLLYWLGAALLLLRYVLAYLRLRLALKKGRAVEDRRVQAVAERYGLPLCPVVELEGLTTAFVCGARRPVLVLPAGGGVDEKVLLHELLHLENQDVLWGLVICLFRCIHWCNPLLWYCANRAGNDLEGACDQRVLERLEGEDRRTYGRILLDMAGEKYAHAPGTSSIANGGKNIRRRILAIARFKKYPAGMGTAAVCILLVLAVPLGVGVRAESQTRREHFASTPLVMAYGRTVRCTTFGGALDTYAKAAMTRRPDYWAMCAPLAEQNKLAELYETGGWSGFRGLNDHNAMDYQIYNLAAVEGDAYEGLLALQLGIPPEGEHWDGHDETQWLAVQNLRVEKEEDRWVVIPLDEFRAVQSRPSGTLERTLPMAVYQGQWGDLTLRLHWQSCCGGVEYRFGSTPLTPETDRSLWPDNTYEMTVYYTGNPENRGQYESISVSGAPIWPGHERKKPGKPAAGAGEGKDAQVGRVSPEGDWKAQHIYGGTTTAGVDYRIPEAYGADLYINDQLAAELTLLPLEGGT